MTTAVISSAGPQYAPAVVELGVLSGLSFKLYTADRTAGALNVFSHVRAFEMLRRISQESQTKLADIAQRVIDTRGQGK